MNKNTEIEVVDLIQPVIMWTGSGTKTERRLTKQHYDLQMVGTQWILAEAKGRKNWIPISNIKSILETSEVNE